MRLLQVSGLLQSIARHRLLVAAASALGVLAVAAAGLTLLDSRTRPETLSGQVITIAPSAPGVVTQTRETRGLVGRTNRISAVRTAPGSGSAVLGTLGAGETLQIDGRSPGGDWLRIVFPPDSPLHGWIDAKMVDLAGDLALVTVATPDPPVVVSVPTTPRRSSTTAPARSTAAAAQGTGGRPTATATSPPTRTAVPSRTPTAKAAGRRP